MYFSSFSLENKLFGKHQTSLLPVEALEFSELKTPLVYTFFPPTQRRPEIIFMISVAVRRDRKGLRLVSASPKPHPSKPRPCNMPQAKTEVALQFSECCAAETALQHWLFCSAEVIWTKSCAAANEKLHCNIEKAALQESGAFLPLSCGLVARAIRNAIRANRFARIICN